jgi:Ca2+-binding EF-hand superfamily protein
MQALGTVASCKLVLYSALRKGWRHSDLPMMCRSETAVARPFADPSTINYSSSKYIITTQAATMSNKAATLAWSLISGDGTRPTGCDFNDQDVLQLKGIFMSLDADKDGFLTTEQLSKAFQFVGLTLKNDVLSQLLTNANGVRTAGVTFDTFVMALSHERKRLASAREQLDALFAFIDSDATGTVSVSELEQLLCAEASPLRFSRPEFSALLLSLDCASPDRRINIEQLKSKLLFGLP